MNPLVFLATWVMLQWTQPPGLAPAAYEAQRGQAGQAWIAAGFYSAPFATAPPPTLIVPGSTATGYVVVTQDPRGLYGVANGGQAIRIRWRASSGTWSPWSNYLVLAGDLTPDSLYSDTGNNWKYAPVSRTVRWSRSYGDTALSRIAPVGPVVSIATLCQLGRR